MHFQKNKIHFDICRKDSFHGICDLYRTSKAESNVSIHVKKIAEAFPSYSEAKVFCDHMMSNQKNKHMELEISPIPLLFNMDENPYTRVSPKNHIPFDLSQIQFPIRCDLCSKDARFFCVIHSLPVLLVLCFHA